MSSKLKISFLILFGLLFSACGNINNCSSVPSEPVFIRLNTDYHMWLINTDFASRTFLVTDRTSIFTYVRAIGYGGVFISVTNAAKGHISAFDMTCPYEMDSNIRVFPDENGLSAVCERCRSRFDLSWGLGNRIEGPAPENLRRLNVQRQGIWLIITQSRCG